MRANRWVALLAAAAVWATTTTVPVLADDNRTLTFTVDVAEDFEGQFVSTPVIPGDIPRRGATFITEGNIFPGGTIQSDGATFDPNGPGAIGRWYCRGIHLVSGPEVPAAPLWVHTAQLFAMPDHRRSLASDGVEGNSVTLRPVTGGTGPFKGYVGQQRQRFLGFNASGGVNLRVTFSLRRVDD